MLERRLKVVLIKIGLLVQALDLEDLSRQATRCIILVPTRELSEQVSSYLKGLCKYCEDIVIANAAGSTSAHLQRHVPLHYFFPFTSPDHKSTQDSAI